MKILKLIIFKMFVVFSTVAWSDPVVASASTKKDFNIYARAETTFPLFVGAGVGINFLDHYDFNVMYGINPELYYNVIGEVAASYGGNSAYKDVIVAAFQNNSIIRAAGNYYFNSVKSGWLIGAGFSYLTSSGQADIDKVLAASTGKNYNNIKNLLIAAGRSPVVDMSAQIMLLDLSGGYAWDLGHSLFFKATGGFAKVFSNTVSLKSGLTAFEATAAGNSFMRQSESDLQSIINDYGVSPTLAAQLDYFF